jgi:hypothetical protein
MGLVGGAIGIDDEMQGGAEDLEIAEADGGAPETEQADAYAEAIDAGVGSFAGVFSAVDDEADGFGFKMEEAPVEGGELDLAAGGLLDLGDEALADEILELGGAHPEVEAGGGERHQNHEAGDAKRDVAEEETAQAAGAVRLLGLGKS